MIENFKRKETFLSCVTPCNTFTKGLYDGMPESEKKLKKQTNYLTKHIKILFLVLAIFVSQTSVLRADSNDLRIIGGGVGALRITMTDRGYMNVEKYIKNGTLPQIYLPAHAELFAVMVDNKIYRSVVDFVIEDLTSFETPSLAPIAKKFTAKDKSFSVTVTISYDVLDPDFFVLSSVIDARNLKYGNISIAYGFDTYINTCNAGAALISPDVNGYNEVYKEAEFDEEFARTLHFIGAKNNLNEAIIGFSPMLGRHFDVVYSGNYKNSLAYKVIAQQKSYMKFGSYNFKNSDCPKNLPWDNGIGVAYRHIPAGEITEIKTKLVFSDNVPGEMDYKWSKKGSQDLQKNLTVSPGTEVSLNLEYKSSFNNIKNIRFDVDLQGLKTNCKIDMEGFKTRGKISCTNGSTHFVASGFEMYHHEQALIRIPIEIEKNKCGRFVIEDQVISNVSNTLLVGTPATLTVLSELNFSETLTAVGCAGNNSVALNIKFPDNITSNEDVTMNINYFGDIAAFAALPSSVTIPAGTNSAKIVVTVLPTAIANSSLTVKLSDIDKPYVAHGKSSTATVLVNPDIAAPTISTSGLLCGGGTVTLSVNDSGTFKWYRNGLLISGENGPSCQTSSEGVYQVVKTINGCTSAFSKSVVLNADICAHPFDDYCMVAVGKTVNINILENDIVKCTALDLSLVTTPVYGAASLNTANELLYSAGKNPGIDVIEYEINCNGKYFFARVYVIVAQSISLNYIACQGTEVNLGMPHIDEMEYFWYDSGTGGSLIENDARDTLVIVKDASDSQTWYAEARYKGHVILPRYKIVVNLSNECGTENPSGCIVDGKLLFKEDFGGNDEHDPRVSIAGLPAGATDYPLSTENKNVAYPDGIRYWLLKYNVNEKGPFNASNPMWHVDFDDHTSPADTTRGYMFMADAGLDATKVYERTIDDLCDNTSLYLSAKIGNLSTPFSNTAQEPILKIELIDDSGNAFVTYITGKIPRDAVDDFKWRSYSFPFKIPEKTSFIKIRISNYVATGGHSAFVIDDIEIRLCAPEITIAKDKDSTCEGVPVSFHGQFKNNGVFGENLSYRWEFRPENKPWQMLEEGDTVMFSDMTLDTVFTLPKIAESNEGYYRIMVGKRGKLNSLNCRMASDSVYLNIGKIPRLPDLRIHVDKLPDRMLPLSSFLDTLDIKTIEWQRSSPAYPGFGDVAVGELNTSDFREHGIYTYIYTASTDCGQSSAKAYVHILNDKVPALYDTISVCVDKKLSKHVQLNQIMGIDFDGIWSYPDDPDDITAKNVTLVSRPSKYAGARIFNAQKAYADAESTNSHNVTYKGKTAKAFSFKYENNTNNKSRMFVIVVTS